MRTPKPRPTGKPSLPGVAPTRKRGRTAALQGGGADFRPGLAAMPEPHATQATGDGDLACERRQLTVLFCDLVGSTAMTAELDPEDAAAILRGYHGRCAELIANAGGFVAQFQGDGVIGFFGYQQARENDPERAVRAALELVESIPKIATEQGRAIGTRIGIATGEVVAGDPARGGTRLEQAVVGDTINFAARLQSIAQPGEVIIADATRQMVGGLFACRNLGPLQLKGYGEPLQVWQVLRARRTFSHFRNFREPVVTKIVGRYAELDALVQKWREAVAGNAQVVRLVGKAGIGKSRLILELRQRIAGENHTWLEGGGTQYFQNTPFHSIAEIILQVLDPADHASPDELYRRLARAMDRAGVDAKTGAPLIAEILGCQAPSSVFPVLAPSERRERLFATLEAWLRALARHDPVVLVFEDCQWVDASTLELIELLSKKWQRLPALIVLSMRESFRTSSVGKTHLIRLRSLPNKDVAELTGKVVIDGRTLPVEVISQVVKRADGIPLFAVELTRLLLDQKVSASEPRVPSTLRGLLTARLDQVGSAKRVAQIAAVIGSKVSLAHLSAVSGIAKTRLQDHLTILTKAGLLKRSGTARDPSFSFRYSLLRDAAYGSLLKSDRRRLHRQISTMLSEHSASQIASRPEVLAYHWTKAGEPELAIAAWRRAADGMSANRAYKEARDVYQAALALLLDQPPTPEREKVELALQCSLAEVFRITQGYSAPQTLEATARARELSQRSGGTAEQFDLAVGAWAAASSSGDYMAASPIADDVLALALSERNEIYLAHAHMIQMTSKYRIGDLFGAEDYFERGKDLFRHPEFRRHPGWAAQTYGNAARVAWSMGDDTLAQQRNDQALSISIKNGNPYDMAFALHMAAALAVLSADLPAAVRFAKESIRIADKHSFPQFAAISRIALGRARAASGVPDAGVSLIRGGLARMTEAGSRVAITVYTTWLAESLLLDGQHDDALSTVEQALRINPQEIYFRPAMLQLRGSLIARQGLAAQAERDFRQSIELSTRMGAKRFYNRATESLHRLIMQAQKN